MQRYELRLILISQLATELEYVHRDITKAKAALDEAEQRSVHLHARWRELMQEASSVREV